MPTFQKSSRDRITEYFDLIYIFLLMAIGLLVRVTGLNKYYYSTDDMWHVHVAKQPDLSSVFRANFTDDGHPVLPYIIWHYLLQLCDNPWMVRLPSLIPGILTIPLAFILGRKIFNSKYGAYYLAFFFTFSELMIEQSQVVRGYALMMLMLIISFLCVYSYRDKPKLRYVFGYFAAMLTALLCEFSVITIIVFSSSYLLVLIWQKSESKYRVACIHLFLNLIILVYIIWFNHELKVIGKIEGFNKLKDNNFVLLCFLFLSKITSSSSLSYFIPAKANELIIFILMICGFIYCLKKRKYVEIYLVISTVITIAVLCYLNKLYFDRSRRMMPILLSTAILIYYGFYSIFHSIDTKFHRNVKYFGFLLMGISISLLAFFFINPAQARRDIGEFSYTNAEIEDFFSYIERNKSRDDIILTTSTMSYFFKERYNDGNIKMFVFKTDMRKCQTYDCVNVSVLQDAVRELNVIQPAKKDQFFWLASMYYDNKSFSAITPVEYYYHLNGNAKLDTYIKNLPESREKLFMQQKVEFDGWLRMHARYKNVKYDCNHTINHKCAIIFAIYGVPADVLTEKMLNSNYIDIY